jgi:hypothetical protein
MFMADRLTLDGPRRDSAGNLIASVLAARTGVQDYAGYEVGKPDMARVSVYRPAEEVFSRDSMRSYAGAPVTIEHPSEAVTPLNWKDHAVGEASEEIVRDGEAVRVPFMLRDAGGIAAVEAGKREISMGYSCDLSFEDGTAPDGTPYQAVQRNIVINHLAIVDQARGGPQLRIGDSAMTTKTITFDGLPVLVTDAAEAVIVKLQGQLKDALEGSGKLTADLATANTGLQTKDGEIAALKQQVTDANDPAKVQALADHRAAVIASAKRMVSAIVTDGKTVAEIKKAAVTAKLGDAAKDMADAAIDGAFAALVPTADARASDPIREQVRDGITVIAAADSAAVRNAARASRY